MSHFLFYNTQQDFFFFYFSNKPTNSKSSTISDFLHKGVWISENHQMKSDFFFFRIRHRATFYTFPNRIQSENWLYYSRHFLFATNLILEMVPQPVIGAEKYFEKGVQKKLVQLSKPFSYYSAACSILTRMQRSQKSLE